MILELLLAAAAAATPAAPPAGDSPADKCTKPVLIDSPTISATLMNAQMEKAQDYVDCMSKAIEVQRKIADDTLATARAEAERTNTMITEINDFLAAVKEYQEKHTDS